MIFEFYTKENFRNSRTTSREFFFKSTFKIIFETYTHKVLEIAELLQKNFFENAFKIIFGICT